MTKASPAKLLFVDDETAILNSLRRFTRRFDWHCEFVESAESALEKIAGESFDVVITDMRMPVMSGATLLQKVRAADPMIVRILLTGYADSEALMEAVNEANIFNFIPKPWDETLLQEFIEGAIRYRELMLSNVALQKRAKEDNSKLIELNESLEQKVQDRTIQLKQALHTIQNKNAQLAGSFNQVLSVLAKLVEHKEGKHNDHSHVVADLCDGIATSMALSDQDKEELKIAALLHDIGTLGLSDNIHHTPFSDLSVKYQNEYEKHPILAEHTIACISEMEAVSRIVRHHHEKLDGSGFPDKLHGSQIPLGSKILSVVSDYHDLLSGLLVAEVQGHDAAINVLQHISASAYDQSIVNSLIEQLAYKQTQSIGAVAVSCADLTESHCLARDLISDSGLLLLAKGTLPSQAAIERLRSYETEANCKLNIFVETRSSVDTTSTE